MAFSLFMEEVADTGLKIARGFSREVASLAEASRQLVEHTLSEHDRATLAAWFAVLVLGGVAVVKAYIWLYAFARSVEAQSVAPRVSAKELRHATWSERARSSVNAQRSSTYASWGQLLLFSTLKYLTEPINVITFAIIWLQIPSGKHKPNTAMVISFYAITLVGELLAHARSRKLDASINETKYSVAYVGDAGSSASVDASGPHPGLRTISAEEIGLGCLVVVPPGARVPIEGLVVPPSLLLPEAAAAAATTAVCPFSYAITGENTILNPIPALHTAAEGGAAGVLPPRWSAVTSVTSRVFTTLEEVEADLAAAARVASVDPSLPPSPAISAFPRSLSAFGLPGEALAAHAGADEGSNAPLSSASLPGSPRGAAAPEAALSRLAAAVDGAQDFGEGDASVVVAAAAGSSWGGRISTAVTAAEAAVAYITTAEREVELLAVAGRRRQDGGSALPTPAAGSGVALSSAGVGGSDAPVGALHVPDLVLPDELLQQPAPGPAPLGVTSATPSGAAGDSFTLPASLSAGAHASGVLPSPSALAASAAPRVSAVSPLPKLAPGAAAAGGASATSPATTSGGPTTLDRPIVHYYVNGRLLDPAVARVPRGTVHAPQPGARDGAAGSAEAAAATLSPLYLLACLPKALDPAAFGAGARVPPPSSWARTIRAVMAVQVGVMMIYSFGGWSIASRVTGTPITIGTFVSFLLGQVVLSNTFLPLRESLVNSFFLGLCKSFVPGALVKSNVALETLRRISCVVSDKTGTLTSNTMTYKWPLPAPQEVAGGTPELAAAAAHVGPLLLLATNDSRRNPLYKPASYPSAAPSSSSSSSQGAVDGRLETTPALCTTSEEGVIYYTLTTRPEARAAEAAAEEEALGLPAAASSAAPALEADRFYEPVYVPSDSSGGGSAHGPQPLRVVVYREVRTGPYATATGQPPLLWRMLTHYLGGFEPDFVARFSVVSLWCRPELAGGEHVEGVDIKPAAGLAELASRGWVPVSLEGPGFLSSASPTPLLVLQGGGDAVARVCGDAAATWEQQRLRLDPSRTFGHAVTAFTPAAAGMEGVLLPAWVDATDAAACLDDSVPRGLTRDEVMLYHRSQLATAAGSPVSPYHLCCLSKFGNPLVPGADSLYARLVRQGVRLHICSGDTYLTLRSVMGDMGIFNEGGSGGGGEGLVAATKSPTSLKRRSSVPRLAAADVAPGAAGEAGNEEEAAQEPTTPGGTRLPTAGEAGSSRETLWDIRTVRGLLEELTEGGGEGGSPIPAADAAPIARVLAIADKLQAAGSGGAHIVFCSADCLHVLHSKRSHPRVQALTGHPRVVFGLYRIKQTLKPLAIDIFSPPAAAAPADDAAGVGGVDPAFMGDGPNDEAALASTTHSVAIAGGSVAARNSSNFEVQSSALLPDLIRLARLFHGGRAVILRDVVFSGSFVVLLLATAAYIAAFQPLGNRAGTSAAAAASAAVDAALSGGLGLPPPPSASSARTHIHVLDDPWSPLLMLAFTVAVHTPRAVALAISEGLRGVWGNHRFMVLKVVAEVIASVTCAVWVGTRLRASIVTDAADAATDNDQDTTVEDSLRMFAPLALGSLAVIVYARDLLVIQKPWVYTVLPFVGGKGATKAQAATTAAEAGTDELPEETLADFSQPSLLSRRAPASSAAGAGPQEASCNDKLANVGPAIRTGFLGFINHPLGQGVVLLLFFLLLSRKQMPLTECVSIVLDATKIPLAGMLAWHALVTLAVLARWWVTTAVLAPRSASASHLKTE